MGIRGGRRWVAILTTGAVLLLHAELLCADSVKLDGGASLNGSVTTSSKAVTVRTSSGAVIVFDRGDVKQVKSRPRQIASSQTAVQRLKTTQGYDP